MIEAAALKTDLVAWCESYVRAFEAYDVEAIGNHWSFPALLVSGGRTLAMIDAAGFNKNTGALTAFYQRQNVASVKREVIAVQTMGNDTAAMQVRDAMCEADGTVIAGWVSAYVLQRSSDGWKAIFADAQGELDAWAARGTPLGS